MITERLRKRWPHILDLYLEQVADLVVLFVDASGVIRDCNQGFLRFIDRPTLGSKCPLADFFPKIDPAELSSHRPTDRPGAKVQANCGGFEHSLEVEVFAVDDGYVLIGQKPMLSDNHVFSEMSTITNELTNLSRELKRKNHQLEMANNRIETLARTDGLTGLFNRRYFMKVLERSVSMARRHGRCLSLVMADLDHFKAINDTFGHRVGDDALRVFGKILRNSCRQEDISARYGGEEFICLLSETSASQASAFAERVRGDLAGATIDSLPRSLTASFGVAILSGSETADSFIKRADEAMYTAKKSGRNRVQLSSAA